MAPLLRASLLGLRCSRYIPSPYLSSPREPMKLPESSCIVRRWYGESAALEETCSSTQTVNDTAGKSRAVLQGEKSVKETPTANGNQQDCAAEELSSTDKLSSLIMGKLRSKNNANAHKEHSTPLQTDSTSSRGNKVPEEGAQKIGKEKWDQVMSSMRNMGAKKKQNLASSGAMPNLAKSNEVEDQDDFADLDLPQARDESFISKVASNQARDALRNFTPNVKPKEGETQGLNGKQKVNGLKGFQLRAQEVKPTSFSFLDSLDSPASNSGATEDLNDRPFFKSIKDSPISFLNEPKTASSKPKTDREHLKFLQDSSHQRSAVFREFEKTYVEDKERESSYSKEVANIFNRTSYPGYTVCIQNLPSQTNLALVKEALSLHGEVVSSFKKSTSDLSCNAFVGFKTAEAMESALASRSLSLDSKAFSIVMADAPITTVVRLSRVSADTTDTEVGFICEKFGSFEHLKRRATGVYDVYYKANELSNMSTILNCLNEVTLNQRRLLALPAPRLLSALRREVLKRSEGQAWHASQSSEILNRIETGLEAVAVLFEDLKSLAAMEDEISRLV